MRTRIQVPGWHLEGFKMFYFNHIGQIFQRISQRKRTVVRRIEWKTKRFVYYHNSLFVVNEKNAGGEFLH